MEMVVVVVGQGGTAKKIGRLWCCVLKDEEGKNMKREREKGGVYIYIYIDKKWGLLQVCYST